MHKYCVTASKFEWLLTKASILSENHIHQSNAAQHMSQRPSGPVFYMKTNNTNFSFCSFPQTEIHNSDVHFLLAYTLITTYSCSG